MMVMVAQPGEYIILKTTEWYTLKWANCKVHELYLNKVGAKKEKQ